MCKLPRYLELSVHFGVELVVVVGTDVVLTLPVGTVSVHQQHVFTTKRKEIGAGAVLYYLGPLAFRFVEWPDIVPLFEVI